MVVKKDRSDGSRDVRVGVSLAALIRGQTDEPLHLVSYSTQPSADLPTLHFFASVSNTFQHRKPDQLHLKVAEHPLCRTPTSLGIPLYFCITTRKTPALLFYRTSSTSVPLLLIQSPPSQNRWQPKPVFDVQNLFCYGAFIVAEQCVMWVW